MVMLLCRYIFIIVSIHDMRFFNDKLTFCKILFRVFFLSLQDFDSIKTYSMIQHNEVFTTGRFSWYLNFTLAPLCWSTHEFQFRSVWSIEVNMQS